MVNVCKAVGKIPIVLLDVIFFRYETAPLGFKYRCTSIDRLIGLTSEGSKIMEVETKAQRMK
jgi:hypothetical protein